MSLQGDMERVTCGSVPTKSVVKAKLKLGSEIHTVDVNEGGTISEQLVVMKEESMRILKEFITKHNVPNDVPDESVEGSSEEDEEVTEKPRAAKSKKTKLT